MPATVHIFARRVFSRKWIRSAVFGICTSECRNICLLRHFIADFTVFQLSFEKRRTAVGWWQVGKEVVYFRLDSLCCIHCHRPCMFSGDVFRQYSFLFSKPFCSIFYFNRILPIGKHLLYIKNQPQNIRQTDYSLFSASTYFSGENICRQNYPHRHSVCSRVFGNLCYVCGHSKRIRPASRRILKKSSPIIKRQISTLI